VAEPEEEENENEVKFYVKSKVLFGIAAQLYMGYPRVFSWGIVIEYVRNKRAKVVLLHDDF
jgi:hypothetical protein